MPQIKKSTYIQWMIVVALVLIVAVGCSKTNKDAIFDADSGEHPENWYTEHRATYNADPGVCYECHGADLLGGTSGVSCYSANFDGMSCHANGPVGHPAGWADPTSHGASAKAAPNPSTTSGFSSCQACHGTNFGGGSSNKSCFSCHGLSAPHAKAPWRLFSGSTSTYTHVDTDTGNSAACAECHLNSGAAAAANCFNNSLCHAVPNCVYCHTKPPSGAAAPNRAGAHAAHYALAGLVDSCDTCHSTAGLGTSKHKNATVDVLFLSAYSAKSGAAVKNADGTCSKVSCHGGQTTPAWLSGTAIDVNTSCTSCHAYGTDEYNSFHSGKHDAHVNVNSLACTVCHDTAKLATGHLVSLNTTSLEGPASSTTITAINYNSTTRSCNPGLGGLTGCHNSRGWGL